MDLKNNYYSKEEKQYILSKIDMAWWKISEGLKKFWVERYKEEQLLKNERIRKNI